MVPVVSLRGAQGLECPRRRVGQGDTTTIGPPTDSTSGSLQCPRRPVGYEGKAEVGPWFPSVSTGLLGAFSPVQQTDSTTRQPTEANQVDPL
jgi:hypothetical protein